MAVHAPKNAIFSPTKSRFRFFRGGENRVFDFSQEGKSRFRLFRGRENRVFDFFVGEKIAFSTFSGPQSDASAF